MNLIKKSTVFDQNIKSENYESYKIYFEKNIKFDKKVKFDKNIKVEKNIEFQLYPPPPPPPPILWICYLIFSGPKRNFGKPRGNRLDFGIVTAVILLLSWHHQQFQGEKLSCNAASGSQLLIDFYNFDQIS